MSALRTPRPALLVAVATALLVIVPPAPAPAHAAAVDAAMTEDSLPSTIFSPAYIRVFDTAAGATLAASMDGGQLDMRHLSLSGEVLRRVQLSPPTGQSLSPGTYDARYSPTSTSVGFRRGINGSPLCTSPDTASTVTIHDVATEGAAVTRLVASYDVACSSGRMTGELRYGSTAPYRSLSAPAVDFGEGPVGQLRERTVTVTNRGTEAATLGQSTLVDPGDFAVSEDACSGTTLAPRATCGVRIAFHPDTAGADHVRLHVPDDTVLGARTVLVRASAVAPPPAPVAESYGGSDGIAVTARPTYRPEGGPTVTSHRVYRMSASEATQLIGEIPSAEGHFLDAAAVPGEVARYQVRAVGPGGEGAAASTTVTRPLTEAVEPGDVHALAVDVPRHVGSTNPAPASSLVTPTQAAQPGSVTLTGTTGLGEHFVRIGLPRAGLSSGTHQVSPRGSHEPGTVPIDLAVEGTGCESVTGSLTVHAVSHRATGVLDVLDADAVLACDGSPLDRSLQLRLAGSRPVVAAVATPAHLAWQATRVGTTSAPQTVTLRNLGGSTVELGGRTTEGPHAGEFAVTADDCPAALVPGQACRLTLTSSPSAHGVRSALLRVADSTPAGSRTVPLASLGVMPPSAVRELTLTTSSDAAHLAFTPPASDGGRPLTGYRVERTTDGAPPVLLLTLPGDVTRHTDSGLQRGRRYSYRVTPLNSVGAGPGATTDALGLVSREILAVASRDDEQKYALVRLPVPQQAGRSVPLVWADDIATPSTSADGRQLAYSADVRSEGYGVVVAARTGAGARFLTSGQDDLAPVFSPDGRTIVFTRVHGSSTALYRIPVAGGPGTLIPGTSGLGRAVFTHDGRRLISSTIGDGTSSSLPALVTIGLDGSGRAELPGGERGYNPTLSPDGRTVVYVHVDADTVPARRYTSIRALPVAGGSSRVVAAPSGLSDWPAVSVDGRTVAFEHSGVFGGVIANADILTAAFGGGSVENVTRTPGVDEVEPVIVDIDTTPPTVVLRAPTLRTTTARTLPISFTATDAVSGVATYDVRYRQARYDGSYGPHVHPPTWQRTSATTITQTLPAGYDRCVSVRARDRFGNTSGWSPERCTASPVDDNALRAAGGFARTASAGSYGGAVSVARRAGATLTLPTVRGKALRLLVTTCNGCGAITVSVAGKVLGTVSTHAATGRKQVLVPVPGAGVLRSGALVVRTTSGRAVQVDGLVVLP